MSKKGDMTEVSVSWKTTPRQQITAINQGTAVYSRCRSSGGIKEEDAHEAKHGQGAAVVSRPAI